jgi:hypothetical protein
MDAMHAQLEFVDRELPRFIEPGAWEASAYDNYVSRIFLVPNPVNNHGRLICDSRPLNKYCARKRSRWRHYSE